MHKNDIADLIEEKYSELMTWLENQPDEYWTKGPKNKWTTGQQALHLLQSIKPLNDALSMPKWLLRLKYGKAKRVFKDYDVLVADYQKQLKEKKGFIYKPSRNMKVPTLLDKHYLLNRLQTEHKKLQYKVKRISEVNLDTVVLPHPILGKMPVREIIMWTAHHAEHHTRILKRDYPY
ncbi:DinB family protein [Winogradskyella epiphytica]|uniref:DinB family protein n=1 Tax=Winogradskyella epiphytica TaxID=262005 RepID=A0A2V4WXC7_9FLAO|nr:DinB family protein [Winogradskyella epiphytica]PYE81906.1 DinB family protein [Winogradskyella epiphytica]GGW61892.1 hypothetical protein GCM10008085_11880 [Winogradskyella epiphytica]